MAVTAVHSDGSHVVWGTESASSLAVTIFAITRDANVQLIEHPGNIGQCAAFTIIEDGANVSMRVSLKNDVTYPVSGAVIGVKPKGFEAVVELVKVIGTPNVRRFNDRPSFMEIHAFNRGDITLVVA